MSLINSKLKVRTEIILLIIMVVAVFLRFFNLAGQSLWLDELHTMNEADPNLSAKELFNYLATVDQHPPLFFFAEKFAFIVFGYDEFGARILPAVAGILSVWVSYFLGKEVANKKVGLFSAAITCVNIYNITYSQEARGYIFLWLFGALSYLFFIRLYKNVRLKDALGYILFTALMLYSHYFSLMTVCAQIVLGIVLWIIDKEKRKEFFLMFLVSGIVLLALYIPWLPFLRKMGAIHSFWIGPLEPGFFFDFYYQYFTNAIFITTPLIIYFYYVAWKGRPFLHLRENPIQFTAIFAFVSILVTVLIPYLRSVLVVPMLVPRYIIIIIPIFILCIAYGLDLINNVKTRNVILSLFLLISILDLFIIKKPYFNQKEQFREVTAYIAHGNKTFPLINELTGWHQSYYLKQFGYTGTVWEGSKESSVDSILSGSYKADTFWIVGAHGDPHLSENKRKQLDSAFVLVKEQEFNKAWAQEFARKIK